MGPVTRKHSVRYRLLFVGAIYLHCLAVSANEIREPILVAGNQQSGGSGNWSENTSALNVQRRSLVMQGLSLAAQGQHELAILKFDSALVITPIDAEALGQRAMSKLALKRYKEALTDFDHALNAERTAETIGFLHCGRALCFSAVGRKLQALSELNKSIDAAPHLASSWFHRSLLLEEFGEIESALKDATRAAELDPEDPEFKNVRERIRQRLRQSD